MNGSPSPVCDKLDSRSNIPQADRRTTGCAAVCTRSLLFILCTYGAAVNGIHTRALLATRHSGVLVETQKKRQQLDARHLAQKHSIPIFAFLGRRNSATRPIGTFGSVEPPRIRNITRTFMLTVGRQDLIVHQILLVSTEGFLYLSIKKFSYSAIEKFV